LSIWFRLCITTHWEETEQFITTFRNANNSSIQTGVSTAVVVGTATTRNVATTNITRIKRLGYVSVATAEVYVTFLCSNRVSLQGWNRSLWVYYMERIVIRCSCCCRSKMFIVNELT
jgi:activator of HSP90 ATPase